MLIKGAYSRTGRSENFRQCAEKIKNSQNNDKVARGLIVSDACAISLNSDISFFEERDIIDQFGLMHLPNYLPETRCLLCSSPAFKPIRQQNTQSLRLAA
jgi:hypothetical protein